MRVLLVDIGNSRIKWCVADTTSRWPVECVERASNVVALSDRATLGARWSALHEPGVAAAHVANVADRDAGDAVRAAIKAVWGDIGVHVLVPRDKQGGVVNGYRDPSQLGADRWALLIGASACFPGQTLVVASLGTATTIDLLVYDAAATAGSDPIRFAGGLILPGVETMRRSLERDTARLPLARGHVAAFADNTDDAIESGIVAAQAGAIARAVQQHGHVDARCVLTGGAAALVAPYLKLVATIAPDLVLRGLFSIACELEGQREGQRENCDPRTSRPPCGVNKQV